MITRKLSSSPSVLRAVPRTSVGILNSGSKPGWLRVTCCALVFAAASFVPLGRASAQSAPVVTDAYHSAAGVPYTAEQINTLLPQTVYFQGKSAPLQLRNAGGVTFANGEILWASLVDTSGYSTGVQEKYQFYLVTEGPVRFGNVQLPAGAYGGGFVKDGFLLMDLGGHILFQGPIQQDAAFSRPRPLQIVRDSPNSVKLYLGRHSVLLAADPSAAPPK